MNNFIAKFIAWSLLIVVAFGGVFAAENDVTASAVKKEESATDEIKSLREKGKELYDNKKYEEAFKCYESAADKGNAYSIYKLGHMHCKGKGVKKDYKQAFELFSKAAALGEAKAYSGLAGLYFQGKGGVKKDFKKALELYQKAADMGDPGGYAGMGVIAQLGEKKDYKEALKWYQKAAAMNDERALRNIGYLYYYGYGVKKDYVKAAEYNKKAAELGDLPAMINIGSFYWNGYGVKKNIPEALKWLEKATEEGDTNSYMSISAIYLLRFPPDIKKAKGYVQKALDNAEDNKKLKEEAKEFLYTLTMLEKMFGMISGGKGVFNVYFLLLSSLFAIYQLVAVICLIVYLYRKFSRKKSEEPKPTSFTVIDAIAAPELFLLANIPFLWGCSLLTGDLDGMMKYTLLASGGGGLISIAAWIFVVKWRKWSFTKSFKLESVKNLKLLKWVVACMLIIFAGNELYEYVCGICGVSLSAQEVANIIESFVSRGMLGGICVVLLGGIIVPVCEEIIFRGVVFQGFLSKTPFWVASIASSLIFALMHMEISSVLPIFAMGMIFCYSYKKSGSLLVPIAIHCVNNILSCVLLFV